MKSIKIDTFKMPEEIVIELKDLRNKQHPEFEDYSDINNHIKEAIKQNGLRYYGLSIFEKVYEQNLTVRLGLYQHLYHLLGGAKGVIKFRIKHSISSLSRYKNHNYEALDLLDKDVLLKYKGKVYKGCNGLQRIELIESVSKLCNGLERPKVLEVGCGSGLNIYLLNSLNPEIVIHGFEYTNSRIASAIINLFYSPICKNLFLADICELKIPDDTYDVVYSNHVLEQLGQRNAEKALNEMWRVCKKGIVLSEPSIHGANIYEKWRMKILGYCEDLYTPAKKLPNSKILVYKEDNYRTYPNTSHHLVVEKMKNATQ
jgi:ubiquinone/menaquinone biosynthesis C-methylase UbiE